MQRTTSQPTRPTQDRARPARKLSLAKETLRRLTPNQLRLAAGGAARPRASGTCRPTDYCGAIVG